MIRTMQRRFIVIAMGSMLVVLSAIIGIINYSNYRHVVADADALLSVIAENEGVFPQGNNEPPRENEPPKGEQKKEPKEKKELSPETEYTTRFFTVELSENGEVVTIDTGKIAAVSTEGARQMAIDLFDGQKNKGFYGDYRYRGVDSSNGILYIFLDCGDDLANFRSFLWNSLGTSAVGMVLVWLLVVFFSRLAMAPVAESYEKQKQFITDASHELKTPLTIIDANTEVLEMMQGESEWTRSIRNQVGRLSDFTQKLITLSRMEEEKPRVSFTDFSLSDAVIETAEDFVSVAASKGKELTLSITEGISYHGDEFAIRQVVSLLLDNAVKYTKEEGTISLTLKPVGKNKVLTVENTVATYPEQSPERWFERFYRADSSRNSDTGGNGIGLSTAKAIVLAHKGKITARCITGPVIQITVTL